MSRSERRLHAKVDDENGENKKRPRYFCFARPVLPDGFAITLFCSENLS
jgi:hypothetical protein